MSDEFEADGDTNTNAVLFSKDDLILNGDGNLTILVVDGGEYDITAEAGIEATYVQINGGTIIINGNKVDQIPESMQFGKM